MELLKKEVAVSAVKAAARDLSQHNAPGANAIEEEIAKIG